MLPNRRLDSYPPGRQIERVDPAKLAEGGIWSAFVARAAKTPRVEAILAPGRASLRFGELPSRLEATRVALNRLGLGRSDRVAAVLPNGPETAVCALSVMASATFVPLNPKYTAEEFRRYFERLAPKAVIVPGQRQTLARQAANAMGIPVIDLIPDEESPAGWFTLASERVSPCTFPEWNGPEDAALILLTSGTTSRPKLVPLRVKHLLSYAESMCRHFDLGPTDRCVHVMPMFHGHGIKSSLLNALVAGSGVVCPPEFETESFFDHLERFAPTWYSASYTIHQAVLGAVENHRGAVERSQLRFIRSGSGRLDPTIMEGLEAAFETAVIERYGGSETSTVTMNRLPPGSRKAGTVGTPVDCVARIRTDNGEIVGEAEREGEVVVRGPHVFDGYLDDTEANDAAFADGWFRTGDVGYFDTDGFLTITGRIKEFINRGGEKIGPSEVERVLFEHPEVSEPCVVGIAHPTLGQEVVAAVVRPPGATVDGAQLQKLARERLAPFKVPRRILFVDRIPRGATGKVDRRAVAGLFTPCEAGRKPTKGPSSMLEAALGSVWASVLGRDEVGATDDFFLLGGDSLLAVRLVAAVRDVLNVELPAESVFDGASTVASMAELIERTRAEVSNRDVARGSTAIRKRAANTASPLSFSQQRLWFLDQLEEASAAYLEPKAFRVRGPLDVAALRRALSSLERRHESLRTRFVATGGVPEQVVSPEPQLELPVIDLRGQPESARENAASESITRFIREPFELSQAAPMRATLLQLADDHYIFLWVLHHIITDGTSTSILNRDLAALYGQEVTGTKASLPKLPIQYADYAVWQRDPAREEVFEQDLAYWQKQLDGAHPVLELPTDRPRPAVRTGRRGTCFFDIDPGLADRMNELTRQSGVTAFMTYLTVFFILLHRYSRQTDIVVGSPSSGRDRSEVQDLVGFFINTLPMRANLSGNPTFNALAGHVRGVVRDALSHRDLPFDKLVEDLSPERSLAVTPIFQVVFQHRRSDVAVPDFEGLDVERLDVDTAALKYDVYLSLVDHGDRLKARLEYNRDLFDATTAHRLSAHYQALLASVSEHPDATLSGLPMLSEREQHRLLVEWNRTEAAYPKTRCVHDLIEAQAIETPEAVAVELEGEARSYRELSSEVNHLAHTLRRRGVGPGSLVGIFLERSLDMMVALLGVWKAGAAYVPLDPSFPRERLSFMVRDSGLSLLLTQSSLRVSLPVDDVAFIELDANVEMDEEESSRRFESPAGPEDLAYVIYTSGSTGTPKGVQVEHRALMNFLWAMRHQPGLDAGDTLVAVTTLSFDIAGLELYLPLLCGARLVVASREQASDGRRLVELIRDSGATVMQATPTTWRMLLDAGWSGSPGLKIFCGGESLSRELANELLERCDSLWNLYGPTETTVWSTLSRVEPGDAPVLVGRPIANTRVHILDENCLPVPPGVPGELYIGGDGLARGYLGQTTLTAERFVSDPFEHTPRARLYRSGDIARYHEDGRIEVLGRYDNQVKVRGFRIELGEIESALVAHPAVRQAVVTAREDLPGYKNLVAYFLTESASTSKVGELRSHLKEKLPDYMLPTAYVELVSFPLTPNGKIDRHRLPAPDQSRSDLDKPVVAPRDEIELQLADIWQSLLGVEQVGVHDSFFELGGHSLLAVRMFALIEQRVGVHLPLATLFQAETVAELAERLRGAEGGDSWSCLVLIQAGGERPPLFCIHAEGGEVLFYREFARLLGPDQPVYGLQAQGLDGKQEPHATFEEMAAHYIEEIRRVQPEGPYFLGGHCYGGVIMFEMAQQLNQQGHDVALLAMMDVPGPRINMSLGAKLRYAWKAFCTSPLRLLAHVLTTEVPTRLRRTRRNLQSRLQPTRDDEPQDGVDSVHDRVRRAIADANRHYVPQPYAGRITYFMNSRRAQLPHNKWSELAEEGLDRYVFRFAARGPFEPPAVETLAQQLRPLLSRGHDPQPAETVESSQSHVHRSPS